MTPNSLADPLYDAIRRYAARLLSDPEAGKDIAQEVFLRLEQQRDSITNPQAWTYKTARNLVIDHYRRVAKNTPGRTEPLTDDLPADATRFDPVILTEKKEILTMIQQKINDLSPRHREVLRLKFQEGLKYAEIAEILGETVTTVAWLLHEAIAMLRKEMKAGNATWKPGAQQRGATGSGHYAPLRSRLSLTHLPFNPYQNNDNHR